MKMTVLTDAEEATVKQWKVCRKRVWWWQDSMLNMWSEPIHYKCVMLVITSTVQDALEKWLKETK